MKLKLVSGAINLSRIHSSHPGDVRDSLIIWKLYGILYLYLRSLYSNLKSSYFFPLHYKSDFAETDIVLTKPLYPGRNHSQGSSQQDPKNLARYFLRHNRPFPCSRSIYILAVCTNLVTIKEPWMFVLNSNIVFITRTRKTG